MLLQHRFAFRCRALAPLLLGATTLKAHAQMDPQRIYARALTSDPSVALARQKLNEMQARYGEAQANRRPQLSANGNASVSHGNLPANQGTQSFYTLQGGLSLTFPNFGKSAAGINASRAQLRAAEYQLNSALADLAFRASDAYYAVLKADDAVTIAQQNLTQAERQVSDTQKRIAAGDVPPSDLLKAQVPAEQARAALARVQSAAITAHQTLNALIGEDLSAPTSLNAPPTPAPLQFTQDQAVAQALQRSPDLLAAQANVQNAQYAVDVARHALDPTFSLQGTQTHTTDPTTYTNLGSVGLSLTIPLSDGGIARQQIKEAEAQLHQAQQTLKQTEIQTRLTAASSYIAAQSASSDLTASQRVLSIAEESATKAQQAYEAGLTTTRDVLDALLAVSQARSDVNNARYAYALALAKLRQVMGETSP